MKPKENTIEQKKKKRQFVYGIHDLLFLPLIVGMAFTKEEDEKKQQEKVHHARNQVVNTIDEQLQEAEYKLEQIDISSETKGVSSSIHDDTFEMSSIQRQGELEKVKIEVDEIEKQLLSLVIDEKEYKVESDGEKSDMSLPTEDKNNVTIPLEILEEYHAWLEEQPIQEKFYDVKEKEMEVQGKLFSLDPEFDLSHYEVHLDDFKEQLAHITKALLQQEQELKKMKNQLSLPMKIVDKMSIKIEFTSQLLLESMVLHHAISRSKINPFSKLILQTMVLNRAVKQSKKVIRTTEKIPPVNFEKQLYAAFSDARYLKTTIEGALHQSKKMLKEFCLEFADYKDQIPEYDEMIQRFENMQTMLFEKKKSLESFQTELEKINQANRQKQKEYLSD